MIRIAIVLMLLLIVIVWLSIKNQLLENDVEALKQRIFFINEKHTKEILKYNDILDSMGADLKELKNRVAGLKDDGNLEVKW